MALLADSIDGNGIYAVRSEADKDGNRIDTTYAKLADIPSVPVTDVEVNGTSVVSSGVAEVTVPTKTSDLTNDSNFITLADVPAQVQADWTESDSSDPSYIANKPTINNVPAVTSSDDNKVLKASYTGGVGSYSWETETGTTYSAGTGIDITSNTISVENPLPASTSAEAGKYLKVDANGDPTWATGGGGGGGVNADWDETDPLEPSYIENKPTPKTLTAGANISISEGQNTLTISAAAGLPASTSADEGKCLVVDSNGDPEWGTGGKTYTGTDGVVVDNVNDTVGLEAPVDIVAGPGIVVDNPDGNTVRISYSGYNETLLWSSSTAASSFTLSEIITNFERLKILMQYNGMKSWCDGTIVSAAQFTVACCGYANNSGDGNRLQIFGGSFTSSDGKFFASEAGKCIYFSNGNASIGGGRTAACTFLKIYGVNRIAND